MKLKNVSVKIIGIPASALVKPTQEDMEKSNVPVYPDETRNITDEFAASESAQRLRQLGYVKITKDAARKVENGFDDEEVEDTPVVEATQPEAVTEPKKSRRKKV